MQADEAQTFQTAKNIKIILLIMPFVFFFSLYLFTGCYSYQGEFLRTQQEFVPGG